MLPKYSFDRREGREDGSLRIKVLQWLKNHLREARELNLTDLINMYGVGEVNTSLLLTEVVHDSGFFDEQDFNDIIEDETHWVHDLIIDAADWYEEE